MEDGRKLSDFMAAVHWQGRDNARTPIQWDDSKNAGFTSGTPWIDLNPNYPKINVASQESDPDSILNFYRTMIEVRKNNLTLVYGDYKIIDVLSTKNYIYKRYDDDSEYYVFINFSEEKIPFNLQSIEGINQRQVLISNYKEEVDIANNLYNLRPWEATIFKTR
jgi:oligo-1,6-glucosidase